MIPAPWTAVRSTPNRSPRQAVGRRGVIAHHPAGTNFDGLRHAVMGGRPVSYTAIVNRGEAELIVTSSADRPWSVANAHWDSAMRSVCLNNSTGGPGWHVADDTLETAAQSIAHWASVEGWWPHRDGDRRAWTVIGHGELRTIHGAGYATACPGGVPLDELTRRAQQLMHHTPTPEETTMAHLIHIDPAVDGRWFLVDYAAGTAQRLWNHVQLELVSSDPRVLNVQGPQPLLAIEGLTINGEPFKAAVFGEAIYHGPGSRDPDLSDAEHDNSGEEP